MCPCAPVACCHSDAYALHVHGDCCTRRSVVMPRFRVLVYVIDLSAAGLDSQRDKQIPGI